MLDRDTCLICIGDGDNIGDIIDFYLLSEKISEAHEFSQKVKTAIEKIAELAQNEIQASLVYVAGDDICFIVKSDSDLLNRLTCYSDLFLKLTGKTISFGIGKTSIEALISLRKAKVSGKGCVMTFGGYCK